MPTASRPSPAPLVTRGSDPWWGARGRRLAGLAVATGLGLLAATAPVAAASTVPAPASSASASSGPASSAPAASPGDTLRGVLERLSVEHEGAGNLIGKGARSAEITTWIHAGDQRVQIAPDAVTDVATGSQLIVRLAPESAPGTARRVISVTALPRSTVKSAPSTTAAGAAHAVTVMLALPAGAHPDAMTTARLTTSIIGGASRFWSQQSDGRITFGVSRALGWTHLTHGCTAVWGLWDEARQRSGLVPGTRRHLLLYVPPDAGCPSGLGTVSPSADAGGYAMVSGVTTGLLAHELGHNLGLGHSDALACDGAADGGFVAGHWAAGCTHEDYGDWYDVMGISWDNLGTLSTAHAYRLGLLSPSSVLAVTGPARAVLRPVSGRTGLRSLRVTAPDGAVYFVEYRPAAGVDAWLDAAPDWRGLRPGVLVRRIDPEDSTRTLLLDASPSPTAQAASDWNFPLAIGQSLTTACGRVTIRVESETAGAATVVVSRDGASPAVLLQPAGRLINGAQVTIGDAPAAWAALGL